MSLKLNITDYLSKSGDPDWGGTGSVFIRLFPAFTINDSAAHVFYCKQRFPFTINFFVFSKDAVNTVSVGFYDGVEQRLVVASATDVLTFLAGSSHIFTWNTAAPNQEYYADNVLRASSAAAFTVPTGTSTVIFGHIYTSSPEQGAETYISEHGRWNRVLTAKERQVLQVTGCPLFVPNGLVEYHPMERLASAGRDLMGATHLTTVGAPAEGGASIIILPQSGRAQSETPPLPTFVAPPAITTAITLHTPVLSISGVETTVAPPALTIATAAPAPSFIADMTCVVPALNVSVIARTPASVDFEEEVIQEDEQTLEPANFKVRILDYVGGDDLRISRTYTGLAGGISVSKAYLTIKRLATYGDSTAILQKEISATETVSGQITDDTTTGGSLALYFDLTSTETATLTPLVPYHYDVQIISIAGAIYTCEKGVMVMQQGVTAAIT